MSPDFRWNGWNLEHATRHGVTVAEIERVVRVGRPRKMGNGKFYCVGRGRGGRWIQAIFLIDPEETFYVIHARELTDREKRQQRRRHP